MSIGAWLSGMTPSRIATSTRRLGIRGPDRWGPRRVVVLSVIRSPLVAAVSLGAGAVGGLPQKGCSSRLLMEGFGPGGC
ncbi:hypothetical protein GCM10017602_13110 [Herbiconiux flava]|nr:hypothetical protein GCM10017602_13110 [Herbiconiux flava]